MYVGSPDVQLSRFEAWISVKSDNLSLADLEMLIGLASGEGGYTQGDPAPARSQRRRRFARWELPLHWEEGVHAGTEGLDTALTALPLELADQVSKAGALDCSVSLEVVQELSNGGDPWDRGFGLSVSAMAWLVRAGAELDLDQYVVDPDDE